MKINKDKENLIITIPLYQDSFDATMEKCWEIENTIWVICWDEVWFIQVIDLGYKCSFDYGDFIVKLDMNKDEFKKLCNDIKIYCYEYPICSGCKNVIYGAYTLGIDLQPICDTCNDIINNWI